MNNCYYNIYDFTFCQEKQAYMQSFNAFPSEVEQMYILIHYSFTIYELQPKYHNLHRLLYILVQCLTAIAINSLKYLCFCSTLWYKSFGLIRMLIYTVQSSNNITYMHAIQVLYLAVVQHSHTHTHTHTHTIQHLVIKCFMNPVHHLCRQIQQFLYKYHLLLATAFSILHHYIKES